MKKIIIIILLFLLWGFWQTVQAADLLLRYPVIAGEEVTTETTLPNLIKYIYLFALGIAGVVALLSMLIGAVRYIMSAGNPSKAGDAKDQIYSAILGIILLLASVIILRTINPDLVNIGFALPEINPQMPITPPSGESWRCCYCCKIGGLSCTPSLDLDTRTNVTQSQALSWCDQRARNECLDVSSGNHVSRVRPSNLQCSE